MKTINNKQYKECDVVMLATDKPSKLWLSTKRQNYLIFDKFPRTTVEYVYPQNIYITNNEEIKEGDWYLTFQNNQVIGELRKCEDSSYSFIHCKKIIATTDKLIIKHMFDENGVRTVDFDVEVPKIPQSFIEYFVEQYNKGNVIDKVLVEYELDIYWDNGKKYHYSDKRLKLKINSDNTINILTQKDSWSRDEVIEIIKKLSMSHFEFEINNKMWQYPGGLNKWIEENL